jgi:DNA-binding transcriptional LysR family regulator
MEQIYMFSKIALERSISRAAYQIHISQPALSQQMQRLEEELGVRLFERSNKGITLTRSGEVMQKYSEQFLELYGNLKEELENLSTFSGTIKIAATPVACNYALPCTLFKVNHHYPNYSFSLNSVPSKAVINRIIHGQADLGFIVGKAVEPNLNCTLAFRDRLCLVANSHFRIDNNVTLKDLTHIPTIMLNEQFSSYRLLCQYLCKKGYSMDEFKIMYQLDSTESVKSAVLAGHGVAFLPYITVKKEIYQKQLKILSMDDFELDYNIYSIYNSKAVRENPSLETIIKYFISNVAKSIC